MHVRSAGKTWVSAAFPLWLAHSAGQSLERLMLAVNAQNFAYSTKASFYKLTVSR